MMAVVDLPGHLPVPGITTDTAWLQAYTHVVRHSRENQNQGG